MTPAEFYLCLEGYKMRLKAQDQRRAYFTSLLLTAHSTKPVSVDDVYKPLWHTQDEIVAHREQGAKDEKAGLMEEFGLTDKEV